MQNPELFEKAMKNSFMRKPYTLPSGKIIYIQGYEWMCLDYLFKNNISENDIITGVKEVPEVRYLIDGEPSERYYYMDIYIQSQDKAIEVKSTYTYGTECAKNRAKWLKSSNKFKGGIDIYVFDKKGFLVLKQTLKNEKLIDEKINKNCKEYNCYNFDR